jgi:hypothetical protein
MNNLRQVHVDERVLAVLHSCVVEPRKSRRSRCVVAWEQGL